MSGAIAASAPGTHGDAIERDVARAALVSAVLRHESVLALFLQLRATRRKRQELQLPWALLPTLVANPDKVEAVLGPLQPVLAETRAEALAAIGAVLRKLQIPWGWAASEVAAAHEYWLGEMDSREWNEGAERADAASVMAELTPLNNVVLNLVRQEIERPTTSSLPPRRAATGPVAISASRFARLGGLLAARLRKAGASEDEIAEAVADLAADASPTDDWVALWQDVTLEGAGDRALRLETDLELPAPPMVRSWWTLQRARAAIDDWARTAHGIVDLIATPALDRGVIPDKRREMIARDVDVWYRLTVSHESVAELARSVFSNPEQRPLVRRARERAARLLEME